MNRKTIFLLLLCLVQLTTKAQMFEFSAKDASKLAGRKLIVILQGEEKEMLFRFKKEPERLAKYRGLVKYSNDKLKEAVTNYWKSGQSVEYKTLEECLTLSETSQEYITLEFASLRQNENTQLFRSKLDTTNVYALRTELMQRKEFGFFELKFIEKIRGNAFYTFNVPASVPNEYDIITAVQFMSALVIEKMKDAKFNTRDYELKIQQANVKLLSKTFVVDTGVVNRQNKKYLYIRSEYDSTAKYQLSNPQGICKTIKDGDTGFAYLAIVPYIDPIARGQSFIGTAGGNINDYEKITYYMQLVFDCKTGEVLYYDKSEESVVLVRDWKRFLRYTKESVFTMPTRKKEDNTIPPTQKYYPNQNQQNQY